MSPARNERIKLGVCVASLAVIPFAVRDAIREKNRLSHRPLKSLLRGR